MCEKPKEEQHPEVEVPAKDLPRSYYYDDAHGYEDFDPDSDKVEANEDEESA